MNTPTRTQEFDVGVIVEWYDDNDIVLFAGSSQSRPAMDIWAEQVLADTRRKEGRIKHVIDLTANQTVITPYLRSKVKEVNNAYPNVTGFVAVIVRENLLTQAIRLFINREMMRGLPSMNARMFFNRDDALAWLREQNFD